MKIVVTGLRYPDAFAERTASSYLVDVAYIEGYDDASVTLVPDPSISDLEAEETQNWIRSQIDYALSKSLEPGAVIQVTFSAK